MVGAKTNVENNSGGIKGSGSLFWLPVPLLVEEGGWPVFAVVPSAHMERQRQSAAILSFSLSSTVMNGLRLSLSDPLCLSPSFIT